MSAFDPKIINQLLNISISDAIEEMMKFDEKKLINYATNNLILVTSDPAMISFVNDKLLSYVTEIVTYTLPVISEGGQKVTSLVIQELLPELGLKFNISLENLDEYSNALLLLIALVCIRDTDLAVKFSRLKSAEFRATGYGI